MVLKLCPRSSSALIKKFEDALAKHNTERCSLGPPMGLDESELLALSANKDLCFNYTKKEQEAVPTAPEMKEQVLVRREPPLSPIPLARQDSNDIALVAARR